MTTTDPQADRRVLTPAEAKELRRIVNDFVAACARYAEDQAGIIPADISRRARTMGNAEEQFTQWLLAHTIVPPGLADWSRQRRADPHGATDHA